ncbi:NAD P-binding protein [Gloeophyllum trabeum ATCC 11539]|uniref:NAD P-binding protein n=1 Tax=Gloeophyllum trabeum (strain ATCC 11539 / FP-39264 / Madison 617) TaxID=670483 RepID=S7RD36_GLOTA|nr:NAD P-binding protein [Gloeophyllum trabeum ATCC 11539]EPQ50339.1 NAD P-binding protein [Gloeophyllum trabeum ATCC 11539]
MSGFKHFAIQGAGNIGVFLAEELLKLKKEGTIERVVILTRGSSSGRDTLSQLAAQGATIAAVDYTSAPSLTSALVGIDVVISTVGGAALATQEPLAAAAKAANVKLFVPSEYGVVTQGRTEGILAYKNTLHRKLEELKLPYALFYTGPFADFIFNPTFGWDRPNGKITIAGEGKTPVSWTTRRDIARFIAYVTTRLSPDQLYWKEFPIEGDRKTLNEVAEAYLAKTGKKYEVTHTPRSELEAALKENPNNFVAWLKLAWEQGEGLTAKTPEETANKLYPDWNPTPVVDALIATDP